MSGQEDLSGHFGSESSIASQEAIIICYAKAAELESRQRRVAETFWACMPDGTVVQIAADDGRPEHGWPLRRYLEQCDNFIPAGHSASGKQSRGTFLSRFSTVRPKSSHSLSTEFDERYGTYRVNYGKYPIDDLPLKEAVVIGGIIHGVTLVDSLAVKLSVIGEEDISQAIHDRRLYDEACGVLNTKKVHMADALRRVGSACLVDLLQLNFEELAINRYCGYSALDYATFDFKLGVRDVSIRAEPSTLIVSMAKDDASDAYQLDHTVTMEWGPRLSVASHHPELLGDPYDDKVREARDFPDKVRRAFVDAECRSFEVKYSKLTDALAVVVRLLQAPIDSNHVLTPYYYGIDEPRLFITIIDSNTLSTTSRDGLTAYYSVCEDGSLEEIF